MQVALITGAARRVGAAIAQKLHAHGYNVVIHYRNSKSEAQTLAQQLNAQRPNSAQTLQADLADISKLDNLIAQALSFWGQLDVLVNNASSFYATPLANLTGQQWDELFASNCKAPLFLAKFAALYLTKTQGTIINITDIHASKPLRNHTIYCMAKASLHMLTLSLAKELAPHVTVNSIAPGAVCWPEGDNKLAETRKQKIIDKSVLKRMGTANDVADAVLMLVSKPNYITGQTIVIDGGRSV